MGRDGKACFGWSGGIYRGGAEVAKGREAGDANEMSCSGGSVTADADEEAGDVVGKLKLEL